MQNAFNLLSFVASLAVPYISRLSHKRQDFREGGYWTQNACFDFLYTFFPKKKILISRRIL